MINFIKLNNNSYKIKFKENINNKLINSLLNTNLIKGGHKNDNNELYLNAYSIDNIRDYFNSLNSEDKVLSIINLLKDLTTQLHYLINEENSIILCYNIDNIYKINKNFVALENDLILPIKSYKNRSENEELKILEGIIISYPLNLINYYISPQLLNRNIPYFIHYKCSYYSIAYLIIDLINPIINNDPLISLENSYLKNTKLYYLLKRCLNEDHERISLLYI